MLYIVVMQDGLNIDLYTTTLNQRYKNTKTDLFSVQFLKFYL